MKGFENMRCLLGKTSDGKTIIKNKIFRSDRLNNLSEEDFQTLKELGIKYIIDLRSEEEVQNDPYLVPKHFIYEHISALKTKSGIENFYFLSLLSEASTPEDVYEVSTFVREGYKVLPFQNNAYKRIFELLLTTEEGILYHCSSGKDRTGLISALIQILLGVDHKLILDDYLLSNDNLRPNFKKSLSEYNIPKDTLEMIYYCCEVHIELLQSSFDEILKKYDNIDCYFEKEYGLTKEKITLLRNKYLEEVN